MEFVYLCPGVNAFKKKHKLVRCLFFNLLGSNLLAGWSNGQAFGYLTCSSHLGSSRLSPTASAQGPGPAPPPSPPLPHPPPPPSPRTGPPGEPSCPLSAPRGACASKASWEVHGSSFFPLFGDLAFLTMFIFQSHIWLMLSVGIESRQEILFP